MGMGMLLLLDRLWLDSLGRHVTNHLVWDLTKNLLGKKSNVLSIVVVFHKLDNITLSFVKLVIRKFHIICIKDLHVSEIIIAYSYNNDTDGMLRHLYNFVDCFSHVMNASISENQQHVIKLHLRFLFFDHKIHDSLKHILEHSRSPKPHLFEALPVCVEHIL